MNKCSFRQAEPTGAGPAGNPVRSILIWWVLTFFPASVTLPLYSADPPDSAEVLAAMKKATAFYREKLAVQGGYASAWPLDFSEGMTESRASPTIISIQPHGTTTVGLTMLRAFVATGETPFLDGATGAVEALVATQLSSGGWDDDFDFDPEIAAKYHTRRDLEAGDTDPGKRRQTSTLDDHKTTSALQLLLAYVHTEGITPGPEIVRSLEFGIAGLLAAQFPGGAWPQKFDGSADPDMPVLKATIPETWPREFPKANYTGYATLNDGNLTHVMEFLLRAHELTSEPRFMESAKRLGEFLLLAQLEGTQPAWAQQYDEKMHPVWARKFEPPAVSSVESYGAAETLAMLWAATGEERFRAAIFPALDWLEQSRLEDGRWARFYELETNKPLYCDAETYEITYDDSNLPSHYGFKIESGLESKISRMRDLLELSPEDALRKQQPPTHPESWAKRARGVIGKVKTAMDLQKEDGYWIDDDLIDAGLFVKHVGAMAYYLEALRMAEKK